MYENAEKSSNDSDSRRGSRKLGDIEIGSVRSKGSKRSNRSKRSGKSMGKKESSVGKRAQ